MKKNKNKKIRVMWNGRKMCNIYPYATKWEVFKFKVKRFFRQMFILSTVVGVMVAVYMLGGFMNPTVHIVQADAPMPAVLDRIAKAESYDSQFCTASIVKKSGCHSYEVGSVLIHVNKNGTYDIGKYAINSTHLSEAKAEGYDVYQEQDNENFALALFDKHGSEPWNSSKYIWNQ